MSSITVVLALAVPVTMAGFAPPPQLATAPPPTVAASPVQPGVPGAVALPQQSVNEQLAAQALARAHQRVEQARAAFAAFNAAVPSEPRTVCGTQLHEVDPAVDPKIIVAPTERSPEPKVRRITPTMCHEPR